MNALFNQLRRSRLATLNATSDGDLLARYLATGDEAAFEQLVQRHGPAVYGACHRHLPDAADAADAFQAVWLVLVRRAGKLAGRAALGPWLFQVAVWTARNLRRKNARRLAVSGPSAETLPDPSPDLADLRLDLDAALAALPEKYRTPVVLCHLEGWSRRDAAAHLGCPEGTLSALLSRALAKLRKQLGADPTPLLALASVTLPTGLATAAVRVADVFRTASLSAVGVSPAVADLTRGVLRMFWVKKVVATTLVFVATLGVGIGVGLNPGPKPLAASQPPALAKKDDPTPQELEQQVNKLRSQKAALEKYLEMAKMGRALLTEDQLQRARQNHQEAKRLLDEVLQQLDALTVPRLEVVLRKGLGIEVHEFEKGREVGFVLCSNHEMAKRILTRTHADPKAPKQLTVRADPECPWSDVKELLDAVKAAGYSSVSFSGRMPNDGRGVTVTNQLTGEDVRVPGFNVYSVDKPVKLNLRRLDLKGDVATYVIEPPDILHIEAHFIAPDGGAHIRLREPFAKECLVRPDGTVALGKYGSVSVTGMTLKKATETIQKHLATKTDGEKVADADLVVTLDVLAFNSMVYYVIVDDGRGEQVYRFPCTGSETVLDAVASVNGVAGLGEVWISRHNRVIVVQWNDITQKGKTETNYKLMPGDRVYVKPAK